MGARESATVFHSKGTFIKKQLDRMSWTERDLQLYAADLEDSENCPESLFLDFFVNGMAGLDSTKVSAEVDWWREKAPMLSLEQWWLGAVGYARASRMAGQNRCVLVDFWEKSLLGDSWVESFEQSRLLNKEFPGSLLWVCWSNSVLENWQQEELGLAKQRVEALDGTFQAFGMRPLFVPVTDPLGAFVAAREMREDESGTTLLVLPSFGNDKLVNASWHMKTVSQYARGMEALHL